MEEYIGREVISKIRAYQEKGWWTVTQEIIQRRTKNLDNWEEWEERNAICSAVATTLEQAQAESTITMLTYLQSLDNDLFNKIESDERKADEQLREGDED